MANHYARESYNIPTSVRIFGAAALAASIAVPAAANAKTLFDYFSPTPVINQITTAGWGASTNQKRDQDNGFEDKSNKYSYWDGRIVKAADGKYHLFCSRWPESAGHWGGWPDSLCIHAVSASNPLGPYIDQGLCYTAQNPQGKGHNVMAGQLADGSYYILTSETIRPAPVYSSKSLDGPWISLGGISVTGNGFPTGNTSSNTTFWPNPDGSILATSRDGIMMVSTSGLKGPYVLKTNSVYDASVKYVSGGTPEDACLWYSGGQYHMVYSYPLDRKMIHLTSLDGITNWKDQGLAVDATKPFIKYTDGTTNVWNKLERPQVYLEDGHVKYFTFAAIDVDKGNDNGNDTHGSKIIVVPFDGVTFDAETGIGGSAGGASGGAAGASGTSATGGRTASGGTSGAGGSLVTGGNRAIGGSGASGGATSIGGSKATGGADSIGGANTLGGGTSPSNSGGATAIFSTGGRVSTGGTANASGGAMANNGGSMSSGGRASGGQIGSGGAPVAGGQVASSGATTSTPGTGTSADDDASKGGGCDCRIAGEHSSSKSLAMLAALGFLSLRMVRRRSTGPVDRAPQARSNG